MAQVLIDTDVLVWLTRGHAGAAARLMNALPWQLSAVTYIELAQGSRNKAELLRIKKGLRAGAARIVPIDESISTRAMKLIDAHALSHGLKLGDALIAATALEHDLSLLTANAKHFKSIRGLKTEAFIP